MSRKIAFGGIFSAIISIIIYFAAVSPSGRISLYVISSFPIAFMIIEFGIGAGLTLYLTSTILSFFLTGNILSILPFIMFFGIYAIVKYGIEKVRSSIIEIILKLMLFNLLLFVTYMVYEVLGVSFELLHASNTTIIIIVALQFIFLVYDYVFTRVIIVYTEKLRFYINKK